MRTRFNKRFHPAAAQGDIATMRSCLDAGCRPDVCDKERRPPLWHAIVNRQEEAVRFLLASGADPSEKRHPLLYTAEERAAAGIVRRLLEAGAAMAYVRTQDFEYAPQETPLYFAASKGKAGMVSALLEHGREAIKDNRLDDGPRLYPLHVAARNGHAEVVRLLLEAGADANQMTEEGMAPLHLATEEVVPLLLSAGANPEAVGRDGWSALHCAVLRGEAAVARLLLEAGANTEHRLPEHPWHGGASREIDAPNAIINPEESFNGRSYPGGATALHLAAMERRTDITRMLLRHGANPFAATAEDDSALALAERHASPLCALLLLEAEEEEEDAGS